MLKKVLIVLLLLLNSSFIIPHKAYSESNFTTGYNVVYSVSEDQTTHATLAVTLKNITSQYYASSYQLQVGFENIKNVKASDANGPMTPEITKTDEGYTIGVEFNKPVVGLGNTLPFTVSFDSPDIATKNGQIWEINIPGIANQNDFTSFNVDVVVPKSFGTPIFIKPVKEDNTLRFTKEELGKSGISLAFGEKQVFDFNLTYHVRNSNVFPINTVIALPPTTNYQDVSIETLVPKPSNVKIDTDGNWLAEYTLLPSARMDIVATGQVELSLTPKKQALTASQRKTYTEEKPYWQTNNVSIKQLASQLKTPEAIYEYVIKTLKYDFSRVTDQKGRLGAVSVLNNPDSAVCLEFTDLFVTLARSAGIPAREVNGFAYTENAKQRPLSLVKDILHAWPEYYDDTLGTWVMVDPTWGNTTGGVDYFHIFDFDHVTFVIKGANSSYPIPAGGYKYAGDENKKDVNVSFSRSVYSSQPKLEVTSLLPHTAVSGFPISGKIEVRNTGKKLSHPQLLTIFSSVLSPSSQQIVVQEIAPFGNQTLPVSFQRTSFLTNKEASFTIQLADRQLIQSLSLTPFLFTKWGIGGIVFVVLTLIIWLIAYQARRIYLLRRKQ